jgi:HEAT repeat protein
MTDYDALVEQLAIKHRAKEARRVLMAAGSAATPALRRGLLHADASVRVLCCVVLDHFMDDAAVPELVENLDHPDARVRRWAMHALACDRCKEGTCRPGEDETLPIAMRMLRGDPSRRVRTEAAHLVGQVAPRVPAVQTELEHARDHDPHPVVRKVAGWYAPGGPLYEKLRAKAALAQRTSASSP